MKVEKVNKAMKAIFFIQIFIKSSFEITERILTSENYFFSK
jgi:hypothetical protein